MQNKLEQENIEKIGKILEVISPKLDELTAILRGGNLNEFEIMVGTGDTLRWNNANTVRKTPTQDELAFELTVILDHYYPQNTKLLMGMMWSNNRIVANEVAKKIAEYRRRDRAQVESQIVALLQAFKQSN